MDINEWEEWYVEILDDFGFLRKDDENTADLLNEILEKHGFLTIDELYADMEDKKNGTSKFIVFGAGPSLKENIKDIKEYDLNKYILIAADGATTALLEEDIVPDIIATDLDGKVTRFLEPPNPFLLDTFTILEDLLMGIEPCF